MLRTFALGALVALLSTLGCKGKGDGAPACGAVGAQFYLLVRADLDKVKLDPTRGRAVEDQLPAMRDSLVAACTEDAWSAEVRRCLAGAADHVTFEACEQHLTDAQRQQLQRPARDETVDAKPSTN